jgi:hypothetical protein
MAGPLFSHNSHQTPPQAGIGDVFRGSSPLSHIPVLRGIRPSMDIKRSAASHDGEEFGAGMCDSKPSGPQQKNPGRSRESQGESSILETRQKNLMQS